MQTTIAYSANSLPTVTQVVSRLLAITDKAAKNLLYGPDFSMSNLNF